VLHTQSAGQASLRVVENNDFKQLPHLTLALRPGSDAALKQFLAFRLGELHGDCSQLSAELERTQVGAGRGSYGGLENCIQCSKKALVVAWSGGRLSDALANVSLSAHGLPQRPPAPCVTSRACHP
jgi:hypothetical protein